MRSAFRKASFCGFSSHGRCSRIDARARTRAGGRLARKALEHSTEKYEGSDYESHAPPFARGRDEPGNREC